MVQILYTMRFKGKAVPANDAGTVLKAATTAQSCTITTEVGTSGVSSSLQAASGGQASCESQVTFTGETSFQEVGSSCLEKKDTGYTSARLGRATSDRALILN